MICRLASQFVLTLSFLLAGVGMARSSSNGVTSGYAERFQALEEGEVRRAESVAGGSSSSLIHLVRELRMLWKQIDLREATISSDSLVVVDVLSSQKVVILANSGFFPVRPGASFVSACGTRMQLVEVRKRVAAAVVSSDFERDLESLKGQEVRALTAL